MNLDIIVLIAGLVFVAVLWYCWVLFNSGADGTENGQPGDLPVTREEALKVGNQNITYQAISRLWAIERVRRVKFEDMARNWRNVEKTVEQAPRVIAFRHVEVNRFYLDHVRTRPFFVGQVLDAVLDILGLLDEHGDCPSVVNRHEKESEKILDDDTYTRLATIPLYLHSIHVAEEAIRHVSEGALVPKAVIAALAHDLGKIPAFYERFYLSAAHPFVGVTVMETKQSVKDLKYFGEIEDAVRNHHQQSNAYLDKVVRDSDHAARRGEVAGFAVKSLKQEKNKGKAADSAAQVKEAAQSDSGKPSAASADAIDLMGVRKGDRIRAKRELVDISPWFEQERFLGDLLKIVNTAQQDEKFWSALELNGYVYVKQSPFWEVIVKHSKKDADVIAAALSEQHMDNIIYSVVMKLKEREKTIATEFIGEGFFGAVFLHNPKADGEKLSELHLIPFRAEAFGDNIKNVSHKKTPLMRNTVALVPKQTIGKRG